VSLDYSDFNKEHSKVALALLNVKMAKAWLRRRSQKSRDIILQKAFCSHWVARSHLNSWVVYPGEEKTRDYSGLWSGHRDTARDNTILHKIYSNMMVRAVKMTTNKVVDMEYMGICGDDEDAMHKSVESALLYLGAHAVCGYTVNPHKQLVDFEVHEFLQRYAVANSLPIRPLAPMVATFATGSWYKMSYVYYDTIIDSMNSNMIELRNRGAKLYNLLRIGKKILDGMFTVTTNEGKTRKLEWWDYRGGSGYVQGQKHPLWGVVEGGKQLPHFEKTNIIPLKTAPSKATDEWIEMNEKWCRALGSAELAAYKRQLLRESYKPFFGMEAQKQRDNEAHLIFQDRRPRKEEIDATMTKVAEKWEKVVVPLKEVKREMVKMHGSRRPVTRETILDRMNLDPTLFEMIGGWEGVVKYGGPGALKFYQHIPRPRKPKYEWESCVDPAIGSWMLTRFND
jgi:hypothetical protein